MLEDFYVSIGKNAPVKLYYERRSKQYDSLPIQKQNIITLTAQLKSFLSMFLNEPHSTHRYYGELLKSYRNRLFVEGHSLFPYYISGYTFYALEQAFNNQSLDRWYKPFRFQILMLFRILSEETIVPHLNSDRKIYKYCVSLQDVLNNVDNRVLTFQKAANIIKNVYEVKKYNSVREATRLKSFTTRLIDYSKGSTDIASTKRNTGTIRWFSAIKGYGFINIDGFTDDAFIHYTEIDKSGYIFPRAGQKVNFILHKTPKGYVAKNLNYS